MDDLKIFIGGQWRRGGGNPMQSHFPADGSINATLNAASLDDLEEAVAAGERAWRDPAWRNSLPHMRAKILHNVADLIESRVDALAQMQSRDNGKPLAEARGLVMSAAGTARYFAAACELLEGELPTPRQPDLLTLSCYEPLGVVAAITPWNSPIASEMQKVAPAIAAGNAVILKPAEATPLMALELGGKSPTIVLEDADIEQAARGICYGIFSSAGQACIAGSRLFIHESIYAPLMARLLELTRGLRVGHPFTDGVHVGPLINEKHRQSVIQYVELAKREGGRVLCGGEIPADPALVNGSFFLPTIIEGLSNSARACQEEIFGPVLVAMPFGDEATLIHEANDSVYGLAAGIWTRDTGRALRLSEQLEAGTVWINTYKVFAISTPFGGFKESGLGREKGIQGLKAWMQQKSIYLATGNSVNHWCD
ncbi:putative aldehyde dehydrogenase [Enterobacter hormaechei]|uniref:aldehyde dehydrogenase family protein n=1 Tax=Enterobacter hormaechei TaxID=158836 RepID=UPI000794651F|nr:aldehyde dehydrogenase family protein [Enterobacter hormaechei]SAC37247.1 putative aldehyde dehydrogenase [Enterobacter hormaechei]